MIRKLTTNTKEQMEAPIFISVEVEDNFFSRRLGEAKFSHMEYIVKLMIIDAEIIKDGSRIIAQTNNSTSDLIVSFFGNLFSFGGN